MAPWTIFLLAGLGMIALGCLIGWVGSLGETSPLPRGRYPSTLGYTKYPTRSKYLDPEIAAGREKERATRETEIQDCLRMMEELRKPLARTTYDKHEQ